jgi:hypothetical protein
MGWRNNTCWFCLSSVNKCNFNVTMQHLFLSDIYLISIRSTSVDHHHVHTLLLKLLRPPQYVAWKQCYLYCLQNCWKSGWQVRVFACGGGKRERERVWVCELSAPGWVRLFCVWWEPSAVATRCNKMSERRKWLTRINIKLWIVKLAENVKWHQFNT